MSSKAKQQPNNGLSFLFRALPLDKETLEAVPVCMTEQAWNYVTPAEIHPQLCVFRKVFNDANPYFMMFERPAVAVPPRDTPLPVMSAAEHTKLVQVAKAISAQPKLYDVTHPIEATLVRLMNIPCYVGIGLVIGGATKGDSVMWIAGVCALALACLSPLAYCVVSDRYDTKVLQAYDANKNRQLQAMQRVVALLNGPCCPTGYRWRVHNDYDDCNIQLYLDILNPNRVAGAVAVAPPTAATDASNSLSAPDYPMADGCTTIEVWPTMDARVDIPPSPGAADQGIIIATDRAFAGDKGAVCTGLDSAV